MSKECNRSGGLIVVYAGSDGHLHMAFSSRALLMLEAGVWAGAAGSVCQRIGDRQGGGQSSCHLPPFWRRWESLSGMRRKNVALSVQSLAVIFHFRIELNNRLRRDDFFFWNVLGKCLAREPPPHRPACSHLGLPGCLKQKHASPHLAQIGWNGKCP